MPRHFTVLSGNPTSTFVKILKIIACPTVTKGKVIKLSLIHPIDLHLQ